MASLALHALKKQLDARDLALVYLFVGEDTKLIDRMVDAVEATIDPADRPFAVDRLYAGEAGCSPIDIAAAARMLPMLGDRRLVIVLRAERLLKPKRAASKQVELVEEEPAESAETDTVDFTPLEDYLAAPVESTTLLFVAGDADWGRRFTKRLLERAQVVAFDGLSNVSPDGARGAAKSWVREELTRVGRTIEEDAVQLLVDRVGGDITRLRADVERLLLYTEGQARITRDDVADGRRASRRSTANGAWSTRLLPATRLAPCSRSPSASTVAIRAHARRAVAVVGVDEVGRARAAVA